MDCGSRIADCGLKESKIQNRESKIDESGTVLVLSGNEPFCVWAEEENVMRSFLIFAVCSFLPITAFAQNGPTVSGSVRNSAGPVDGATVTLTPISEARPAFATTTIADGQFRFNASPGKYIIRASKISGGQTEASMPIETEVRADNVAVHVLNISVTGISETVTISADAQQPLEEVSKAVSVIGGQQMRDRADITLADSLRTIPGFRVQQLGGFGRTASIKSRGLRNQDTAVLVDGIRFRDAASITGDATAFLSDFTLTSVSKVEVLRGAGSSLYGTNAIGGTVDLQTPVPQSGLHGQVSGAFGGMGLGRFRGNVGHGTRDGKFGFNVGLSRTVFTEGIDGEDDARNTNFQSRLEFNPFENTNISARFFVSDAFVALNASPALIGTPPASAVNVINAIPGVNFSPDANDPDNSQKSRFFTGQVVLNQAINPTLSIQGYYQGLVTRRIDTNGMLPASTFPLNDTLRGQIHTVNGQVNWTPNGISQTTFGYEFESEIFDNDSAAVDPVDNFSVYAKQSSNTIFSQERLSFFERRLQLSGAFRVQFFSLKQPIFEPVPNPTYANLVPENPPTAYTGDASVSYYFRSTGTKIRSHVGNGYRIPSLYERFGSFYSDFFGYSSSGNPDLKPERSTGADVGIDQSLFADRIRLSATWFYTDVRKSIDFAFCVPQCLPSPDPFDRFSGYYNTEGRVARGLETSAQFKPSDSTDVFISYTFTNADERNPLNLSVLRSPGIPANQFTAIMTQRIAKRFWVNFDFLATSSYLFPFFYFDLSTFESRYYMYRFKGNRRADLTAGYTFGFKPDKLSLRLFGTIENLFDNEYYENGFRAAGITGRVGLSFAF